MDKNRFLMEQDTVQQKEDRALFDFENEQRQHTILNNFYLVLGLNIFCLLQNTQCTFISPSQILHFILPVDESGNSYTVWLNMLYLYDSDNNNHYVSFHQYSKSQNNICTIYNKDIEEFDDCQNDLTTLKYVGLTTFFLIITVFFIQLWDIQRLRILIKRINQQEKSNSKIKGAFIYFLVISIWTAAILIYFITIASLRETYVSSFGVCFYLSVIGDLMMIIFSFYYRWQKGRYLRYLMMKNLTESEVM